jgi:hypothetical protein
MKRREFLAATSLAALASVSGADGAETKEKQRQPRTRGSRSRRQLYELRHYSIKSKDKQKQVLEHLKDAEIPALNRMRVEQVGVFTMLEGDSADLYVLLVHNSIRSVVMVTSLIDADEQYKKAGAKLMDAPMSDPTYERIESSLLAAFTGIPKLEIPTKKDSRIFQLRIYENHNALAHKKKVEMFNTGGELAIFRKTGMAPVFFGQALIGSKLPNLTYMLGFDDMAAKDKAWGKFKVDPEWLKLKANEYYKDTVSNITNIMLRPASCSQI